MKTAERGNQICSKGAECEHKYYVAGSPFGIHGTDDELYYSLNVW